MKNKFIFIINFALACTLMCYFSCVLLNYNTFLNKYILTFNTIVLDGIFVIDKYNVLFVILCAYIYILSLLYINIFSKFSFKSNLVVLFLIEILLILTFIVNNLLIFIMLFESTIIPIFFFLGVMGSRGRKINAMYLLFFFTVISSIFLFVGCFNLLNINQSLSFDYLQNFPHYELVKERDFILYLFIAGFIAKIPMIPFHIWLPEAHVEAATIGSVILAAIILKVGFYGILRVLSIIKIFNFDILLRQILIMLCLVSIIYGTLLAIQQIDLKKIIAYSSIVHMNIGILPIFFSSEGGHNNSLFLMFSHGLISSSMFFSIGLLYERFHIRNILYYGGIAQFMPIFSAFFLLILLSNMSLPGTCNFIGELGVFNNILQASNIKVLLLLLLSTLFTSIFCILVFGRVLFYQTTGFVNSNMRDLNLLECCIMGSLCFFIVFLGIIPSVLFNLIS